MAEQVLMPKQGNTVESCIIVEWNVNVGDKVEVGDILLSAETDKSTIDVESTAAGVVLARLWEEGDDVPVMEPILIVGKEGESFEIQQPGKEEKSVQAGEPAAAREEPKKISAPASSAPAAGGSTPRARMLSEQLGIPLSAATPTGPKGRIVEKDVRALAGAPLSPAAKAQALKEGVVPPSVGSGMGGRVLVRDLIKTPARVVVDLDAHTDYPVRGIRKVIARRMVESLRTTSQLSLHGWADARALKALRAAFKEDEETSGITIGDLVNFAVVRTLTEFPAFNAHYLGETIRRFEHIHLGVATDTERGLMVPVLFGSDLMSLKELSAQTKVLAARARDGVAQPDELAGSTFTVSNVGSFGIEAFTPVLNIPEVAILGVGTIVLKPVSTKNGVEFIDHIGLSLTMDHQAVDGADAARFMRALIDRIATLDRLLIRMGSNGTV
jgi:pyruvate dehydrogenase E2 component (dihydrolipoamide acetyltransferase)